MDALQPVLCEMPDLPVIRGAAVLAGWVAEALPLERILARLSGPFADEAAMLGASFDTAVLAFLSARLELGMVLQSDVLAACQMFRFSVNDSYSSLSPSRLRLLAIAAPGGLQMNMPIEFITQHLDIALDILFLLPGHPMPDKIPDHDLAMCVISDSDPETLQRLIPILAGWPRPVVNAPGRMAGGRIANMTRDGIATLFADAVGIIAPCTVNRSRDEIESFLANDASASSLMPKGRWPLLVRPVGSHAGRLLECVESADELIAYLINLSAERYYLSEFVDYRDADGSYRKRRVALVQGMPFLCHMAVSDHWMIHYLNAGMAESADKRADEAKAMDNFDDDFGLRHRAAFDTIHRCLGLDYVILDCAEATDGRLVLFEVEMAAIIHLLDPPDLFAYKYPAMREVFTAFEAMLRHVSQKTLA